MSKEYRFGTFVTDFTSEITDEKNDFILRCNDDEDNITFLEDYVEDEWQKYCVSIEKHRKYKRYIENGQVIIDIREDK